MTTAPAVTTHQEFSFTDEDFRALAQLARAQFGLSPDMNPARHWPGSA